MAIFQSVLRALPTERFDYRPHEKSQSAAEIIWTLARETQACRALIDNGLVNWLPEPVPADPQIILSAFERHYAGLDDRIGRLDKSEDRFRRFMGPRETIPVLRAWRS